MRRNTRRRPTGPRRATFAAIALILGGSGLVATNIYASATEGDGASAQDGGATIDCPDVGAELTAVPDAARTDVDNELAALDGQITEAYKQLRSATPEQRQDTGFTDGSIMNPLEEKRGASIERIAVAIGNAAGERPDGLEALAGCELSVPEEQPEGGQGGNGPVAADFVDINTIQPNVQAPAAGEGASQGTFTTSCGVNENGLFNSDNVIVAPGVSNGAHHFHDYIGNQANDAFASDEDLAAADTSCENQSDKSTYYWPVLRLQNGTQEQDANSPGGGIEGNAGEIVTPKEVTLTFQGSPTGDVTAMPRLLRIITGDAKAFVNGTANANASWSCTGLEDRQLKDKYPLCPEGSDVVRTFKFQSCWDGRNIDSANHRTHVAFAAADGSCPGGFQAIPQLVQRIVYDVDAPSLDDGGQTTPLFAVDSFPEQLHKPVTDHGDFINVFDQALMDEMVDCINEGRECDAGALPEEPQQPEEPQEPQQPEEPQETEQPQQPEDPQETEEPQQPEEPQETEQPQEPQNPAPTGDDDGGQSEPATEDPADEDPAASAPANQPKTKATASPTRTAEAPAEEVGTATATPTPSQAAVGAEQEAPAYGTAPQTAGGSLADTGAKLWPAAAGAVLLLVGIVLLRQVRRRA
ncbi:DUF1996 domain-containing protein [Streptomyces cinnabarinus]|uniref:DUF1996 domain-containing protein n=1 Tax=Streptomyces cinnabarinus TaxID=67287 RepID=A0ABY7KNE3_9ACTN|nr:DUF1996 domain-containing protein [Streptomyces cinnabarinus]WAZ26113.1 DUF1996 domain-containing protein [Streptomyces cinnabarinus]